MTNPVNLEVHNNPQESRFEVIVDDKMAIVEYQIAGKNIIFTHTEVPEELEGQGIASKMARTALDYAKTEGYKIQAICPFISSYISKHPEYHSITWGYNKK